MKEYKKPVLSVFLLEDEFNVFLAESVGTENDNDFSDREDWFN